MHKNFFWYSESFKAEIGKTTTKPRQIEYMDLLDLICLESDSQYGFGGDAISRVQSRLSDREVSLGPERIRIFARILQYAYKWLIADDEGKKSIRDKISGGSEYFEFLQSGIRCLENDCIRTWEDIERIAGKDEDTKASVLDIVSGAESKIVLEDALSIKSQDDLGIDLTEEAHEAVDRLIEIISAVTDQNRSMRSDYVDLANELIASQKGKEEVERDYQVLLAKIFEAETLIVEQKVQIASLDEENKKLKKFFHDFSRLKAEFNGASGLSTTFEKAVPEKIPEEIIAEKPEPEFPQWAAFFKRKVVFNKVAEEYLDSLRKKDRSRIVGGISFYINNDPSFYPASNGKKIEGGPYDGCREIKAGKKYRVLLKEEADAIRVIRVFRKGQNVNNIKE